MADFAYHKTCEFGCKVVRKFNRRTLAIYDKTCQWGRPRLVTSKESLKRLFDKKRISNLIYLEGLDILIALRKKKGEKNA